MLQISHHRSSRPTNGCFCISRPPFCAGIRRDGRRFRTHAGIGDRGAYRARRKNRPRKCRTSPSAKLPPGQSPPPLLRNNPPDARIRFQAPSRPKPFPRSIVSSSPPLGKSDAPTHRARAGRKQSAALTRFAPPISALSRVRAFLGRAGVRARVLATTHHDLEKLPPFQLRA